MPLPSSGEIKLSQIRDEFGLTAGQIAMSSLYGRGNAPASTGQIRMGADFHGTAGVTYLVNGTLTAGQVTDKDNYIMRGYDPSTPSSNASIGSVSLSTNTGSLSHMVDTIDNNASNVPRSFHTYMANAASRADTHKIIVGSTTLNRRSLQITRQNIGHINASINGWERYTTGTPNLSSNIGFVNNTTYTIQVVKMGDDETWLDTTMTVGHWTNQDIKSANINHRGFSGNGTGTIGSSGSFNSGGSISSNVLTNPDTGSASGYTLNNVFGNASTANAIATSSIGITGTDNILQANRFRGVLLTKTGGSQLWMSFAPDDSNSSVIPSGATVVTPDQSTTTVIRDRDGTDLYNFLSTSGEQINVKVY